MLFVIEILQYKSAVLRRLGMIHSHRKYPFDVGVIDGLHFSYLVDEMNNIDLHQITLTKIEADIDILYSKYLDKTNMDEYNVLYANFVIQYK